MNPLVADIPLTVADLLRVRRMVYNHCGINLHEGKAELVRWRLTKRLRAGGFGSITEYLDYIKDQASGVEFAHLIDALSTNLTSFFRERPHFDYLAETFI